MKTVKLIFPNQLFEFNPLFSFEGTIYMVEEDLFYRQYNFHKQKIAFHRASMKFYESFLITNKFDVKYISSTDEGSDVRELIGHLKKSGVGTIVIIDPVDNWLSRRIKTSCKNLNLQLKIIESPMFLNTNKDLEHFFTAGKKKYFQTEFYKQERIKRKILLDEKGGPLGGQWTYDADNRKKFPKGKNVVHPEFPATNNFYSEARQYVGKYYPDNPGVLTGESYYPINFEGSNNWLQNFLEYRLAEFGDYEDAIVRNEMLLNHSLLTPMMNVGLITPARVIEKVLEHCSENNIPLNSLEGFIRQVVGWREFIRGVYISKGREERTKNFWSFTRKIPDSFYNGTTGILPVDETIKKVLKTGYCHHIERLMILGNFMLLCEFDPDEVYRWFMELFIDAYDWVMVPNVYGMSQFADGGIMSTKPYISGSNYIFKMSDYPKGEWQEIWDVLFWRFLNKHRIFFLKNPRLGVLVKTYDKWNDIKKKSFELKANDFLSKLNSF